VRTGAPVEREGRGQRSMPVGEASAVSEVRRRAVGAAERLGFDETRRGAVAIVATEVATNLVKHAREGEVAIREVRSGRHAAVEILAFDRGPGISRIADSLRDGYSSAGSPGNGLGAMARMSTRFDISSTVGLGTVVWCEIRNEPLAPPRAGELETGVVCLAIPGEGVCGDGWLVQPMPNDGCSLAVVDGLGHGREAAAAADIALEFLARETTLSPGALLETAHGVLRPTRGAAIAVAEIDAERGLIRYAGVGNIATSVVSAGRSRSLVSMNGTVGHVMSRTREFQEPFPEDAHLVMASDGISARWDLATMPGITSRHPAVIAAAIYRDHGRARDDATVLAVRRRPPA
jgi:anti-sigma regulatory factor (Ser/Thr protein kinase)